MTGEQEPRLPGWLRWLPLGLLVAVAAHQQYLAHTQDLTAWKGGGFGMFATVDELHRRAVFAYLRTDAGEVPLALEPYEDEFGRIYRRTAALPHGDHAHQLAEMLASRTWHAVADPDADDEPVTRRAVPPNEAPADAPPLAFDAVRLEIWRLQFDSAESRLSRRMLASHEVEVKR